jgi:hypothetical protein
MAKQPIPPPLFRAATAADVEQLANFSCGDTEWGRETEEFIRTAALRCHLGDPPEGHYPNTLIVAEADDGQIIGVAAFRRGPIKLLSGSQVNGIVFVVVAIATGSQGTTIEGDGKLSHALVHELARRAARGRRTKEPVCGVVDFRNEHSLALLASLGFKPLEYGAVGMYHDVHGITLNVLLDRLVQLV